MDRWCAGCCFCRGRRRCGLGLAQGRVPSQATVVLYLGSLVKERNKVGLGMSGVRRHWSLKEVVRVAFSCCSLTFGRNVVSWEPCSWLSESVLPAWLTSRLLSLYSLSWLYNFSFDRFLLFHWGRYSEIY